MLRRFLAHPLTRGLDIDDPRTTRLRKQIIGEKQFLQRIYSDWYRLIRADLRGVSGPILELGSGAGLLKKGLPDLIASEVFPCPGIDCVLDGLCLPFADHSLGGIAMIDVFHHLPKPRRFFADAARCVKTGGKIVMIEPWVTPWSKWVYTRLHHEPFDWRIEAWEFQSSGPLSGANGALPYVIFARDREIFQREFPTWSVENILPSMPFRYLLSGGVSMRSLMPGWSYEFWKFLEDRLEGFMPLLAMFCQITLRRTSQ